MTNTKPSTTPTLKTTVKVSISGTGNDIIAWPNTMEYATKGARTRALRLLSKETGLPIQHGLWVRIA